ncbi:MAG: HDIG domain-containing protein [Chloroflexota bacterium]|nr:MAG: HDIG domain-containing protein [Chloroflexota bacterium]
MSAQFSPLSLRRKVFLLTLVITTGGLALIALIYPFAVSITRPTLSPGNVSPQDYRASYVLSYQSEVLTEGEREQAASAVERVYTPTDTDIARGQRERLRSALAFITSVRADAYANAEQKLADLSALEDFSLDREMAENILSLSNPRWQTVQQEAIVVLEQVMRTTIRDDQVDQARRNVPALISLTLPEDQVAIVKELVTAFVVPNSTYDEAFTQEAREQARLSVIPVVRSFVAGETIVSRGVVLTAADLEALEQFGLTDTTFKWQDLVSSAILSILVMTFLSIYFSRNLILETRLRRLAILTLLFLLFLYGARLTIPGHTVIPYLYPLTAYSLTVTVLFGVETALVTTLPLAIMVTYGLPYSLELTLYYVLSSLVGIFIIGRAQRITSFFWTGLAVALSGTAVIFAYRLPQPAIDSTGLATLTAAAFISGIASAGITLLLQFFLAQLMGMTTALQLMELSRPDHPLLQLLLRNAPGTYQHSLQVANLVEQAAERIGADALLTRVGALYHDIGKAIEPVFFIENQVPGAVNPHDELDPAVSAAMIIRHVPQGLDLARKYRLPKRIQDFIAEHHGSMITHYQYTKAKEKSDDSSQVNPEEFRYHGPRPQSRETALLMLADGCEARVRAEHPKDENELRILIKNLIDNRLAMGALNDTDLTLQDLDEIADSFTATLRGVYHPRIQYPKLEGLPSTVENTIQENEANSPPAIEPPPAPTGPAADSPSSSNSI